MIHRPAPGFIPLGLLPYIALAVLVVTNIVTWNLYRSKAHELESFKVAVKVAGDAQNEKARVENQRLFKEKQDADKNLTTARATLARLRGANSGSRKLPGTTAPAGGSGIACYDGAELGGAYGSLVTDLRAIADEGATCQIELGNAREWARTLPAPR